MLDFVGRGVSVVVVVVVVVAIREGKK